VVPIARLSPTSNRKLAWESHRPGAAGAFSSSLARTAPLKLPVETSIGSSLRCVWEVEQYQARRYRDGMYTEAALPESELRMRVQQRIKEGRLPVAFVRLVNAGAGAGGCECPVCDQPVKRDKVEYDPRDADHQLIFHYSCYLIWQRECARRIRAERASLIERQR